MKKYFLFNLLFLLSNNSVFGQIYPDHFGTGNDIGVIATSSPVSNSDSTQATLSGTGYYTDLAGYYRFMAQAGFGATQKDIDSLQQMGIENWKRGVQIQSGTQLARDGSIMDCRFLDCDARFWNGSNNVDTDQNNVSW